jgi:anti-anti-sigma factor
VLYQATDTLPPPRQIVLDLTDLDFLLMAGLRVIHSFAGCCAERAMWTCLVAKPGSTVRRIIDLNLIRPHLPTFDSVEEALESDG